MFAQIAAVELGIGLDQVVEVVDTAISPFGMGSVSSRVTMLGMNTVKAAATAAFRDCSRYARGEPCRSGYPARTDLRFGYPGPACRLAMWSEPMCSAKAMAHRWARGLYT